MSLPANRARRAAPPLLLSLLQASAAAPVAAFPDGAPWEAAQQGAEGCVQCHFDSPPAENSEAVTLLGLPQRVDPGGRYRLTVTLSDADMAAAGFLLSAWQGSDPAGVFVADDERVATNGAQARSTEAGASVDTNGATQWSMQWTAPTELDAAIVFELWANAANGDRSPFEDATHRRKWQIDAAGERGLLRLEQPRETAGRSAAARDP